MLELVKRNIHRNRWKNGVSTQITLDDDFIVPDTMNDAAQLILSAGEIRLEPARVQDEKAAVRGNLDFRVLYRNEEGGLQTLGGQIPFEETVNVPGLRETDTVSIHWQLEDLKTELINSRKLGIRALITLELRAEALEDTEAAVDLAGAAGEEHAHRAGSPGADSLHGTMDGSENAGRPGQAGNSEVSGTPQIEMKKEILDVASIALRRRDTYRVKEELTLAGNKPAIDRLLWTEMRLTGVSVRPLEGKVALEGTLTVFVLYEGEGDQSLVEWTESSVPFSGEVEVSGAEEQMIPSVSVRLVHRGIEEKPDYDGEMRELSVDAVMELDIRLYEEQKLEILSDLYATNRELSYEAREACFDRILTRNSGKCRLAERVELNSLNRILQVCHGTGSVKVDEALPGDGILSIDGVLELQVLYLTDDDAEPVRSATEPIPFHYEASVPGITPESVWYLETGLEQLTVTMAGGAAAEVKAVISLELLVLQPEKHPVITRAELAPLDIRKFQEMPGIVGYLVQTGDTLWDVAKRFHTTIDNIMQINGLTAETVPQGKCLILVKELNRQ